MTTRRQFTAEFKAKVALEAMQGWRTIAELATRHELRPSPITQWKRQAIENPARVFDDKSFVDAGKRELLRLAPVEQRFPSLGKALK